MRQSKSGKRFLACMLALALVASSMTVPVSAKTKAAVKSVKITNVSYGKIVLKKGKSFTLKTKVTTTGKASKKVTFASSNKAVATVSAKGKIKAVKKGTAKITVKSASNSKKKATVKVVVGTPVTKVSLDRSAASLKVGESITLKATVSPKKASEKNVAFLTSDEKIATVTSKGVVNAIAEGTVKITAISKDESKKKAVCTIEVKKEEKASGTEPSTQPSAQPSTQPSAQPSEAPSDYYDPKVTYDYQLSDSDAKAETYAKPSIADEEGAYTLKWSDNFEGTSLNRDDWNVEVHNAGWVNSEQQAYVDSDENIQVKDGNLIIRPIRKKGEDGQDVITSGRVNTQEKHDYTYGLFEARIKVPKGQGFLPAFWMMPTDEQLYGQWPRCGEIDIMEVMGQATDTLYGTIHYGNPEGQSQGKKVVESGADYAEEYHTYACEWEPGKITWYVDGEKYYETSNWYSRTLGQGTVSYPAPFDQPFHLILNLAVGGSWVGYIDETTKLNPSALVVDYVKVFQKDSYDDSNVEAPKEEEVEAVLNKNMIGNANFEEAEDLTDDAGWKFMTQEGGEATAAISDQTMTVVTTKAGTKDYSVQLVHPGVQLKKGAKYQVKFDAYSSEERSMNCAVKAPSLNYYSHYSKNIALKTQKQTYTDTFVMEFDSDKACRLEFNMGAGSIADIHIQNVSLEMIEDAGESVEEKTIRSDGNFIYNSKFQEGDDRLAYWQINADCEIQKKVTPLSDNRRLEITVPDTVTDLASVTVSQNDIPLVKNKKYELSFDLRSDAAKTIRVKINGEIFDLELSEGENQIVKKFVAGDELIDTSLVFELGTPGTIALDNVWIQEDVILKNGSFDAGTTCYEWYADSSASASWGVDSLKNDNAAEITVNNTGDQDWKVQLKQNNVLLEKGKTYKLSFKAKSSLNRNIRVIFQGDKSKDYAVYSNDNIVALTSEYQTFEDEFTMSYATNPEAYLSICMGAISASEIITTTHVIDIDDLVLIEVESKSESKENENMLANADFKNGSLGTAWSETIANWGPEYTTDVDRSIEGNAIQYVIRNVGAEEWHIQLKQSNLSLEKGKTYEMSYDVKSTSSRKIKSGVMSKTYVWYGGEDPVLVANEEKHVSAKFTMKTDDEAADFYISLGQMFEGEGDSAIPIDTPVGTITISNLKLVEIPEVSLETESTF